jgi:hypothetical protein
MYVKSKIIALVSGLSINVFAGPQVDKQPPKDDRIADQKLNELIKKETTKTSSVQLQGVRFRKYTELPNGSLEVTCSIIKNNQEIVEKSISSPSAAGNYMQRRLGQADCLNRLAENFDADIKTKEEIKKELEDKIGEANFMDCINSEAMKAAMPDKMARAKKCFTLASKAAKSRVEGYMSESCKRRSSGSLIVTCEDGSTYKLVDDRGGPAGQHDQLAASVVDIERHIKEDLYKSDIEKEFENDSFFESRNR